jgi:primosomal protein N' (replication factor Y)
MLHFPDFRAFERSFQLLTQVAGRAGRRADVGKVFIQTYNPDHPVLRDVASQDIAALYQEQIAERKAFGYPPIVRMVRITIKHKNYHTVNEAAELLAGPLRQKFGRRVLGPEFPSVARIRNLYNKHFILKLEKQHASGLKKDLQAILNGFALQGGYTSVRIVVDVDPY